MSSAGLERLLLRAALLDGDAARGAWECARRIPGHIDDAPYRVLPQLYRNLVALEVDDPEMARLRGVYNHAWSKSQRLLAEAPNVLGLLRGAGVETLVLGGVAGGGVPRPIERLDVLVRTGAAAEAVELLRRTGRAMPDSGAVARLVRLGDPIALDGVALHTSPFWEPVAEVAIWHHARPAELMGAESLALHPTHELMRACTGGLAVPPAPARWIPDAVSVLRSSAGGIDWELLAGDAERWSMTARLAASLETLRAEFEQPVPDETLERLRRARRPLHERAAHAVGTARGAHHVLQWHRHTTLRTVRPDQAGDFAEYWRDSLGADGWGAVAGRYARRVLDQTRWVSRR